MAGAGWRVLVDRGGTFTDVVAFAADGGFVVRKVLSMDVAGVDATVAALRTLAGEDLRHGIDSVRMGTTVATNALLERRGAALALATTRGFGDSLLIGTQARPDLFALHIRKPEPLTRLVIEVDERVLADGTVRQAPDEGEVRAAMRRAREAGCDAIAIAFVHSWLYPEHELIVGSIAREEGFPLIVLSSDCDPEPGFLARMETTVVDAFVTPPLRAHVGRVSQALGGRDLRLMTSAGGLVRSSAFRGRDAVLSGPAAGAVALGFVAREAGCEQAIGLDMGGTSTDVSRWSAAEDVERSRQRSIAGLHLRAPMVDVVTVAAGGGSILSRIGGRLVAGPSSAGASPGPACYRAGGPPTVTDANIVLGRVLPGWFPSCFGPGGDEPPDPAASRHALTELGAELGLSAEEAALGAVRVANEAMARALRQVSVARGRDPREHALVAFGGAAPQHACALADLLGMTRVLVHPLAGVLSALGMGLADARVDGARALMLPLTEEGVGAAHAALDELEQQQLERVGAEGVPAASRVARRILEVRHRGVESTLALPAPAGTDAAALRDELETRHARVFGFRRDGLAAEIVAARVEAAGALERPPMRKIPTATSRLRPADRGSLLLAGDDGAPVEWDVQVYRVSDLRAGHEITGPALVAGGTCTIVIDPGWRAAVLPSGTLDLRREVADASQAPLAQKAVRLEVFGSRFMGIAEQMGEALRRTAQSPNIKERLDFSCALFTRGGRLVANAPHVPVHLGAMGETVRAILASRGEAGLRPGMAILSNDPYSGGSHLPDITVVTPVFDRGGALAFFVANRGHHADVGGIVPGSMPPFARDLSEEGVVLHDVMLVADGRFREEEIRVLLAAGPHPVRGIPERLADLRAQAAANATGARLLHDLCDEHGGPAIEIAMRDVIEDAAEATSELIESLPQGTHRFSDELDEGARIVVAVHVAGGRACFDFAGTSPQVATSLNAPRAVVRACVLYVLRCLLQRDVPLNDGVLDPVEILIPEGTLLSPRPPAAVCGGNVETSMRVADVLLGALGAQAASQGTMNNVTFGTIDDVPFGTINATVGEEPFAFYETIGGGAGAGPGFAGASAVHSHLTNTRVTDVEALERRAPVIVREFSVRRGTGGRGLFDGGDGIVRALELLKPLHVALLTERRRIPAFGLEGGEAGACGRNVLLRTGVETDLGGKASFEAQAGDVIILQTPGGGGWGAKS